MQCPRPLGVKENKRASAQKKKKKKKKKLILPGLFVAVKAVNKADYSSSLRVPNFLDAKAVDENEQHLLLLLPEEIGKTRGK